MEYIVTDIQRFCMHDGPGIRTTVFLKGCPLRCFWCHNPETHSPRPQIYLYPGKCIGCQSCVQCRQNAHRFAETHVFQRDRCVRCGECADLCPTGALTVTGRRMTDGEILDLVLRDVPFYGKDGGVTLSGGEPMLAPEKCIHLLKLAKQAGLHTAVETSGYFPPEWVQPLAESADLLLWDLKDTDPERHLANTGVPLDRILENLYAADRCGVKLVLRCVLLKGVNLNEDHLRQVKRHFDALPNALRIDLLPCHSLGVSKAEALGIRQDSLVPYEPSEADMRFARTLIYGE